MIRLAKFNSKANPYPLLLPLWRNAIFVDWHKVLCREFFWFSILGKKDHPYFSRLHAAAADLFTKRSDVVADWMRGLLSSEDVVRSLEICLDRRCKDDFLLRRLREDCRRMPAHRELLLELQAARRSSLVVLATDNMDCFIERLRVGRDLEQAVDAVLCSATLGVLKTDSVANFFGPWLSAHNLSFADTVLLDDNQSICAEFSAAGGTAILVRSVEQAIQDLRRWRIARECATDHI